MDTRSRLLSAAVALASLTVGGASSAQTAPDSGGAEVEVRTAAGGFIARLPGAPPMHAVDVNAGLWLGYRLSPQWSVGAMGEYQRLSCDPEEACDEGSYAAISGGLAARWRPLRSASMTPWASVGVAFGAVAFRTTWGSVRSNSFHGVSMPVTVGLDVPMARGLALTLQASVRPWMVVRVCSNVSGVAACDAHDPASSPGGVNALWLVGVGARYTFGQ